MELLAILILPVLFGAPFILGSTRRLGRNADPRQSGADAVGKWLTPSASESAEPPPIRHRRRTCSCNTPGCEE